MLHRIHAFTLIELALVLVIVSLMTGFGLQAFETTGSVNCAAITQDKLKTIDRSLQNFAAANARFPKPAYMNQGSNDPKFGYEAKGTVTDVTLPTYATNVPSGMTNASGVLIGALPHATLGLPAEYAADCWGSKFTYAVTNTQTSSDPGAGFPSSNDGTIELRTGTLSTNQQLSNVTTYVVVSHGEDKFGATPMSAGAPTAGNCDVSANKIDRNNCDTNSTFYSAAMNTGGTNNYFDDLLIYSSKKLSQEDCSNQSFTWNTNCTAMTGVMTHGSVGDINASGSYSGTANVTCTDGSVTITPSTTPTCDPTAPCTTATLKWSHSASNPAGPCEGIATATTHNQWRNNVGNSTAGYTGTVNAQCLNGVWTNYSSISCAPNSCSTSYQSWGPGGVCGNTLPITGPGSYWTGGNGNSGYSGAASFLCSAGVFVLQSSPAPTCNPATNPCASQSVSWGAGCSATTTGSMTHLGTQVVNFSNTNYIGSATATCNNGTATASGSCNAHCIASGAATWGSCSAPRPSILHGNSASVSNTASGFTGSATVSCTNGVYSAPSSTSCTVAAVPPSAQIYCFGGNSQGELGNGGSPAWVTPPTQTTASYVTVTLPSGVTSWKALATDGDMNGHVCAIGSNDRAYCWGANSTQQIGLGGYAPASTPQAVNNALSYKAIAVGTRHSCAITTGNALYCWGHWSGPTCPGNCSNPTLISTPASWKSISTGNDITCGIASNNLAYCWGANNVGQIGDGTTTPRAAPTQVTNPGGVSTWLSIATGHYGMTCGVGNNNQAYCWGQADNALTLGNGSTTISSTPVLVTLPSGETGWKSITLDYYGACGLTSTDRIYCWGKNDNYQLGLGNTTDLNAPTTAIGGGVTSWKTNTTGMNGGRCAIAAVASPSTYNGGLFCWGSGSPTPVRRMYPSGVLGWSAVVGGIQHTCVLSDPNAGPGVCGSASGNSHLAAPSSNLCSTGTASAVSGSVGSFWTWNCNSTACNAGRSCPAQTLNWTPGCSTSRAITENGEGGTTSNTAGGYSGMISFSCTNGVMSTSSPTCGVTAVCGSANGSNVNSAPSTSLCSAGTPSAVTGTGPYLWNCVGAGNTANCAANRRCLAGTATWMTNCSVAMPATDSGSASGTFTNTAPGYTGSASLIGCNQGAWTFPGTNTCTANPAGTGSVYCWGQGMPGNGTGSANNNLPVAATNPSGVTSWTSVTTGAQYSCGIANNDNGYCWGSGASGQLGDNTATNRNVPTLISGGYKWRMLSAGRSNTCGIAKLDYFGSGGDSSQSYCWGEPTPARNLMNTYQPYLTSHYTAGVASADYGQCIQDNPRYNQDSPLRCRTISGVMGILGNGTTSDNMDGIAFTPNVTLPPGVTRWLRVTATQVMHCALGSNGELYCWGGRLDNACGSGTAVTTPAAGLIPKPSGVTSWTFLSGKCAIGNNGNAYCVDHDTGCGSTPKLIVKPGGVTSWLYVTGSDRNFCGIGNNNLLYCWGNGTYGEIGNGSSANVTNPTAVTSPSGVTSWASVSSGDYRTCAISGPPASGCAAVTKLSWNKNSIDCYADIPAMATNTSTSVTASGSNAGSATVTCHSGTLTFDYSTLTCNAPGTCGTANGVNSFSAPSSNLCATGVASAVSGSFTNPWTWTCGATACSAPRSCSGGAALWGPSSVCQGPYSGQNHNGAVSVTNTTSGYTGSVTVTCNHGVYLQSSPICNSSCTGGSAFGQYVNAMDCGVETDASQTCCTSPNKVIYRDHSQNVGSCGLMNWTTVSCAVCKPDGDPTWGHASNCCNGDSDGNGTCGTQTGPINGVCGAADGTKGAPPGGSLCSAGTPTAVTGNGTTTEYKWKCTGISGGTTASCESYPLNSCVGSKANCYDGDQNQNWAPYDETWCAKNKHKYRCDAGTFTDLGTPGACDTGKSGGCVK